MAKEKRPKTYTRLAREAQTPVIGGTCMTLVVAGLVSEAIRGASKMAVVAAVLFACAGVYLFWLAYRIDKQVKEEQAAAAAAAESASEAAEPGAKAAAANGAGSAAKGTAGTPETAHAPKAGAGRIAAMASWTAAEDPEADSGAGPEADPGEGPEAPETDPGEDPEEDTKKDTEGKNDRA